MKKATKYLLIIFLLLFFILFSPNSSFASFNKNNEVVLQVGDLNSWDEKEVFGPSIIEENNSFWLWYSGSNGNKRQIGIAKSINPYSFIKDIYNPIIRWDIISSTDIGVEHPSVTSLTESNQAIFKMWFSNVANNYTSFSIFYTFSYDGISWHTPAKLSFDSSYSWDSLGIGAPSVIYDKTRNIFNLWFVAKGYYNNFTRWRIGYATSSDGINWTKHPQPVLWANKSWEGDDVGNPTVIWEDGLYHMWYHADHDIGHAISTDGINWTKDNYPVLTPGPADFDSIRVLNPFVLKKDDIYYMWYTGIGSDGKWRIGLATSQTLPTQTPTPLVSPTQTASPTPILSSTPTPTFTPTLTLTPTLSVTASVTVSPTTIPSPTRTIEISTTPSPKPTAFFPSVSSPVIFIPGLGASWNPKDIFSCEINSTNDWKLSPFATVYDRLIETLVRNANLKLNKEMYIYTYDWRQPLDKQADMFRKYLEKTFKKKLSTIKLNLIGHSQGGLIIRSYLENYPSDHQVQSVLTIGTPHKGSVLSYPAWENGEIWTNNFLEKIALNLLIDHCQLKYHQFFIKEKKPLFKINSKKETVHLMVPFIKQLLPTFNYLRKNGLIIKSSELFYQNDWINNHPFPPNLYNLKINTLSGEDKSTLRFLDVVDPSAQDLAKGNWIDGKPIEKNYSLEGDGTVLQLSSMIEGADNLIISGNHSQIVSSTTALNQILKFLNLEKIKPAEEKFVPELTSENALSISIDSQAKLKAADPQNIIKQNEEQIIIFFNPKIGIYHLEILPKETIKSNISFIFIDKNQQSISKNYEINLKKNKLKKFLLIFNSLSKSFFNLIPIDE